MELDSQDAECSGGLTCGLRRMLTIQVEIELQNATQIQAMADRAATQVKIQRAVEGLSIIAISYYLLGLIKVSSEAAEHAGFHINPLMMLVAVPLVIGAVAVALFRVRHAIAHDD